MIAFFCSTGGRWNSGKPCPRPEWAHSFVEFNCASCPRPCKRNNCSIEALNVICCETAKSLELGASGRAKRVLKTSLMIHNGRASW